ncbi:putative cutinase 1 [Venturia nashicola]|uniref:cutinase n=1 Tax=Venturia nashicola TaxID=86259 RepID=A0A4Z1NUI4_9PEZI|nr:putative cutinase 1 [Venturia nashicola]TLD30234.1 putative cutinase 1 [Venturia nashicola]
MKFTGLITGAFAAVALAAPAASPAEQAFQAAEVANAQAAGGCSVGFVFARGSTEPSPLGMLIGPALQSALKRQIPNVQTFPVYYAASLGTNISMDRTDAASIAKGVEAFQKASGCEKILAAGYSQGAAVMHNVVQKKLSSEQKQKLLAVALFGDTRNKQDGGHIKDFPTEKTRVWCNPTDGVCGGALNVNAGHLAYSGSQINEAATFLAKAVKSGGSTSSQGKAKSGGSASSEGKAKSGGSASSEGKTKSGGKSSSQGKFTEKEETEPQAE